MHFNKQWSAVRASLWEEGMFPRLVEYYAHHYGYGDAGESSRQMVFCVGHLTHWTGQWTGSEDNGDSSVLVCHAQGENQDSFKNTDQYFDPNSTTFNVGV